MFRFDVVPELGLALHSGKTARLVKSDWMSTIQDGIASLNEQKVQLHRIARVDIAVREEVLSAQ